MDEPLGALDLKLREAMQIEIRRIQRELSITTVYVTHDQTEAMNMSDRIAVMNEGVIEQLGTAEEIYGRPASRFVAGFVGQINLLAGRVVGEDGEWRVVEAAGVRARASKQDSVRAGSEVSLGIRPELFKAVATDAVPSGMNALDGRIAGRTFAGNLLHVYVDIDDGTRVILEARPQDPLGGDGSAIRLRIGETTGRSALLWEYWCDRCRVRCRCERGNMCGRADAIRVRQQREHGKKDASRGGGVVRRSEAVAPPWAQSGHGRRRGDGEFGCGRTQRWCAGVVDAVGFAHGEMSEDSLDDLGRVDAHDDTQRTATHLTALDVDMEDAFEPLHPAHGGWTRRKRLAGALMGGVGDDAVTVLEVRGEHAVIPGEMGAGSWHEGGEADDAKSAGLPICTAMAWSRHWSSACVGARTRWKLGGSSSNV